ncbi:exported hypothetical protein [Candidatus Sulfopaludibacter sp. SbA3]|nr:exported hypothetical protein [Candidatus Sulfopaludibacter sp. SbA3]
MRLRFAAALWCIAASTGYGRPTPFYEDTNNAPVSPEVHSGQTGKCTFRSTHRCFSGISARAQE